jgi:hypothetical protein
VTARVLRVELEGLQQMAERPLSPNPSLGIQRTGLAWFFIYCAWPVGLDDAGNNSPIVGIAGTRETASLSI